MNRIIKTTASKGKETKVRSKEVLVELKLVGKVKAMVRATIVEIRASRIVDFYC